MTDLESKTIVEYLQLKWGESRECPMCGNRSWEVSLKTFELREFHEGNMILGVGPIMPVIPVTCKNCGNTIFLNAIQAGFIKAGK